MNGKLVFKVFGLNEEIIRRAMAEAKRKDEKDELEFTLKTTYLDSRIELNYRETATKLLVDSVVREFAYAVSDYLYAETEVSLNEVLVDLLKLRKLRLSTAESFTGGGVASAVVSVSGASEVFYEGIVAYSGEAKKRRLGVSAESLAKGAVTYDVAYEMAEGLLKEGFSTVAISTTGIAGPNTDASNFPVGLCYIGIGTEQGIDIYKLNLDGDRKNVTQTAINYAMFLAIKHIKYL